MPESINEIFVQQYQNTMRMLCQQKVSKLEATTIPPIKVSGEYLYWEAIGPSEAVDLVTRHGDTPNIEIDHSRRRSSTTPKVWSTLLDRADAGRMLVDPKGAYQQTGMNAMNRAKDRVIIAALGGSAWTGKDGTVELALPAAQKIATGSVGLTITKLLTCQEMFGLAEVADDVKKYFVASFQQRTNLLNTTEATSQDYNTVKALVNGDINSFLGFDFIWSNLLVKSNTTRYCYAYTADAIGYGSLEEITVRVSEMPGKNYSWQPYVSMDMGATRVEDVQVIEVLCTES